jgi:hypothetical protein
MNRLADYTKRQNRGGLGQSLENQHAGHNWQSREMAGKERFINGHILESDGPLAVKLKYAVDQQEGILMRQQLKETLKFSWICLGQDRALT